MVNVGGIRKKAMVYIMDLCQLPGKPPTTYINSIRQGYIDNNLNIKIFGESSQKNSIKYK